MVGKNLLFSMMALCIGNLTTLVFIERQSTIFGHKYMCCLRDKDCSSRNYYTISATDMIPVGRLI